MSDLKRLRSDMNNIDNQILALIRTRMVISGKIGKLKKHKKIPIANKKREKQVLSKLKTPLEKVIFKKIIAESKKIQKSARK